MNSQLSSIQGQHCGRPAIGNDYCNIDTGVSPKDLPGERRLQDPLLQFLLERRWVRSDTLIVHELPWHGRRVDMVTRTRTGSLTSYEFKLGSFGRALEQALYNRMSFDRSYIVIDGMPRPTNLALSELYSVGVIMVAESQATCLLKSPARRANSPLRNRLNARVLEAGEVDV